MIQRLATMALFAGAALAADTATFHKDIEPILQRNCQTCHRPGQIAPDVVPHVSKRAPLGQGYEGGHALPQNAALVCRSQSLDISPTTIP